MSNSCMYSEGESVEMLRMTNPMAIKDHVCSECGGIIKRGEKYKKFAYKFDGTFEVTKRCNACDEISKVLFCNGATLDGMKYDLEDAANDDYLPWGDVENLSIDARNKLFEILSNMGVDFI